jgi:AAA domain
MKEHPDINDTLRSEGPDAVRARHDKAQRYNPKARDMDEEPPWEEGQGDAERLEQEEAAAKANGPGESGSNGKGKLPHILSRAEFLKDFVPPDYLVDGMLQRRFIYSLTGQTGHFKTALALLIARLVACEDESASLGGHLVEKGRVIYFVGENPDDVRMRVIGSDSKRSDDPSKDRISFIPGTFNIGELAHELAVEVDKRGGVDLVIIDTSAAYFLGQDEISNTQMGAHARMLRCLTKLPGGPCVLVLCHPIKHATDPSQLVPRGGGAFLAEVDGNLTIWRRDDVLIDLHHYGKFRGPGFEPMMFRSEKITTTKLTDKKGRLIPTVCIVPVSESEEREQAQAARSDEDTLLFALHTNADRSIADLARACGWLLQTGEPYKSKVQKLLDRLSRQKLVTKSRDTWKLTEKGEKAAGGGTTKKQDRIEDHGGAVSDKPFVAAVREPVGPEVPCIHCHKLGEVFKIADGRLRRSKAEALHKDCAEPFFKGELPL